MGRALEEKEQRREWLACQEQGEGRWTGNRLQELAGRAVRGCSQAKVPLGFPL